MAAVTWWRGQDVAPMTCDYIACEEARLRGVEASTWPPLRIAGE
jgi:hypothetical protein